MNRNRTEPRGGRFGSVRIGGSGWFRFRPVSARGEEEKGEEEGRGAGRPRYGRGDDGRKVGGGRSGKTGAGGGEKGGPHKGEGGKRGPTMTRTLSPVRRSSGARPETQRGEAWVVKHGMRSGWRGAGPGEGVKRTKTARTPAKLTLEELLWKWFTSLTPMQGREGWEDQDGMRRREAEGGQGRGVGPGVVRGCGWWRREEV
ncbi:hypothetical protein NL676_013457 [Syzygium grande]|nr:hypothetical protein NL676_013457 [Syzygium grande]